MMLGSRERVRAYADLLREEAEQETDPSHKAQLTARAAELMADAAGQGPSEEAS